ncbi:MAG: mechanosensitive ion channel [Bacteroidaceae bacterium]|nr:mechanosensitive ion channel [Bacteroidaceae bacterium]
METTINSFIDWMAKIGIPVTHSITITRIIAIVLILVAALIVDKICRKIIIPAIRKITAKTESDLDNHILSDEVLNNICRLVPPIVIAALTPYALFTAPMLQTFIMKFCWIYITIVSVMLVCSVITSLYNISNQNEKLKEHSLKSFYQMFKLVAICIGAIIVISTLIDKSPKIILTGLGAGTAILMLVFQDSIKGLVAGIQLMANDMLRPGDWITVPKHGADGDVLEVSLTTVKVRNWDKTIVTVPPYALVNESFQNWRGMFDIGGRRIKRSINIDMNTVRFCTTEELENFKRQPWMEGFEATGNKEVNLYIFRHYLEYYLHNHPKVSKELTMTVRQLQPTAQGMPVELYFFSADTAWLKYESLQAEVFEHILAMLHTFGLKVFQSPSGTDIKNFQQ